MAGMTGDLKPSGFPWLGDVPVHWEAQRLGQIAVSFRTGPFGRSSGTMRRSWTPCSLATAGPT